jgi:uncharacterized protein YhfF
MRSESVERFWATFCSAVTTVDPGTPYQVWHFGNSREMARELVDLVLSGRKTATASSSNMNALQPEDAPRPDGYSVVTDFDGDPRCVIKTSEIRHVRFDEVDAVFASEEGEGDLSLEYWRRVHRDYFAKEAEQHGFAFDDTSLICCERFTLLFP